MTNKRRESARRRHDPDGNVVCSCGCGRPIGKGRRSWHSQECVERWMIANSSHYVRAKLFQRDKGVCAECGVDAERAQARCEVTHVWHWVRKHDDFVHKWNVRHGWSVPVPRDLMDRHRREFGWHSPRVQWAVEKRRAAMKAEGWDISRRMSWWEADHIVPVVEGGGQCGLDNYRTLCIRCHRKATRELRARLAESRRKPKPTHHENRGTTPDLPDLQCSQVAQGEVPEYPTVVTGGRPDR